LLSTENYDKIRIVKILEDYECENYILSFLADVQKRGGFEIDRHQNYPTTDKQIGPDWELFPTLYNLFHTKIKQIFAEMFDIIDINDVNVTEMFFVKYRHEPNSQISLDPHKDGSEMSFVIALNNEYEGGGTNFIVTDRHVKLKKGECVFFTGKQYHEGISISDGTRYILTGFINYKHEKFCDTVIERIFSDLQSLHHS
jgi:hypothetical protein